MIDEYRLPPSGGGDRYVSSSELAGAPIRIGDRFEAVLTVTPRDPGQVNTWGSSTTASYLFPRDSFQFDYEIGGNAFPGRPEATGLGVDVETGPGRDHVVAYTRFDWASDSLSSTWQEVQLYTREGVDLGTGLPTNASAFDLDQSYLVMRPFTKDWSLQIVLDLDSVRIESDGVLPPGGDPGPGSVVVPPTPIPEPAAFFAFAGLAAVLAARHHRARSGLAVS
jgi:hypothetical protein